MTATLTILKLMADDVPRSTEELAAATGLTVNEVAHALRGMRRQNLFRSQPVRFVITERGHEGIKQRQALQKRVAARASAKSHVFADGTRFCRACRRYSPEAGGIERLGSRPGAGRAAEGH
jgi:predicted transcriptional regulator